MLLYNAFDASAAKSTELAVATPSRRAGCFCETFAARALWVFEGATGMFVYVADERALETMSVILLTLLAGCCVGHV